MKKFFIALLLAAICMILSGCEGSTQAQRVNHNLSVKADNFNVQRRITVWNARTDKILLEMTGYISISNNTSRELVVTCEVGDGEYKKNYIYLNEYTMYVVEDITGSDVNKYKYEINFLPEMIQPISITMED